MSAPERMIAFHIARLKDKNPQVRIKSIQELELLEATDAFGLLEELFRNDPDPDVRVAAQQAGKTLFRVIQKNNEKSAGE